MTLLPILAGLGATLLTALAVTPAASRTPDLTGTYRIVSGEKNGAAVPQANIEDTVVEITRDRIVVTDRDQKETYSASYTLDATQTPWRIAMVSRRAPEENVEATGLIEKKGDTVRLIYALPGGETPTEFKTGPQQLLFVMKAADAAPAR
jgi:uncharacterized protein (TIGR03067 family)